MCSKVFFQHANFYRFEFPATRAAEEFLAWAFAHAQGLVRFVA
jgi:hypothetical protein